MKMGISQILLHLSDLFSGSLSKLRVIFVRSNRGHLCASNCFILEFVIVHYPGMLYVNV